MHQNRTPNPTNASRRPRGVPLALTIVGWLVPAALFAFGLFVAATGQPTLGFLVATAALLAANATFTGDRLAKVRAELRAERHLRAVAEHALNRSDEHLGAALAELARRIGEWEQGK